MEEALGQVLEAADGVLGVDVPEGAPGGRGLEVARGDHRASRVARARARAKCPPSVRRVSAENL